MKKIFISIFSVFALSILFCDIASAANIASSPSEGVIVATVSIDNAKIVSNNNRDYKISFDISNRVGAQPQIKYAVRLTKVLAESEILADEKVYEETLSLGENTTVSRTIDYSIPASLSLGIYRIWIYSENENGLMLGVALVDEIQVAESALNTVEIIPDSCSVSAGIEQYSLSRSITINSADVLTVKCKVTSNFSADITLMPNFVTRSRTVFGDIVFAVIGSSTESVTIKKGANDITLILPKASKPQGYNITFSLISSNKKTISNSISLNYTLIGSGQSGKIQNVVFDKTSYKMGETANLQIFSTQTGTSTIAASVLNSAGKYCSATSSKEISNFSVINLLIPITKDCANPKANIILSAGGNVLDSTSFQIATSNTTTSATGIATGKIVLALILIVFAILGALIYKKKRSALKVFILAIILSSALFGSSKVEAAWTNGLTATCPAPPGTLATLSWNKADDLFQMSHAIRVDNLSNGWNGLCDGGQLPGDICFTKPPVYGPVIVNGSIVKESYSFTSVPGATYSWWIHAIQFGSMWDEGRSGPSFNCIIPTCTSWTYTAWSACSPTTRTQTRTAYSPLPSGCVGGSPVTVQSCTPSTCTSWTYSAWSACSPTTRTQTRTVLSSSPSNCAGGSPVTAQSCTPLPTNTLSASTSTVSYNQSVTLSGTVTDASSCTLAGGPLGTRAWSTNGSFNYTSGSLKSNTSFVLSCSGPGGGPVTKTATISVIPLIPITIDLNANPLTVLSGSSSMISWNITGADSCLITKNGSLWQQSFATYPSRGDDTRQLGAPWGVAVDSAGNIYVADTGNNRIQKFNSSSRYDVSQFGSAGSGNGQFNYPSGIALDSAGNIYVADKNNYRVQKFNSSGAYLSQFTPMYGVNKAAPFGIAVDSSGNIYVSLDGYHEFRKFNSSFTQIWAVNSGSYDSDCSGKGKFDRPFGIAVDSSNNIYVTDSSCNLVQKFNSSGTWLSQFGGAGTGNGQFYRPWGITIDSAGNIYVVDSSCGATGAGCDNNRVQKFNSSGTYLLKFGGTGTGNGQFTYPIGITRDSSNNIYVTDIVDNRIQKFNSSGTYLSQITSRPSRELYVIVPATIAGSKSSGNLSTATVFTAQCNNSGNSATKSVTVDITTLPKPTVILDANESEIRWEVTDADSCILTEDGVWVISTAMSGSIPADELEEGTKFTLVCTNSEGTVSKTVESVAPAVSSNCIPTQTGNAPGDANIYVNRKTTWTVNLSATGTVITSRKWSGTNVPATTGLILNKIYTTVGKKNIQVKTTGTLNGKAFNSTCHATTTVKLAPGTGGEI